MEDNLYFKEDELINLLPIPTIITDCEGNIIYLNNMVLNIYEYDYGDIKGKKIQDFEVDIEEKKIMEKIMGYTYNTCEKKRVLRRHRTRCNNLVDMDVSIDVFNRNGKKYLILCLLDVTKQQELFRTYERAVDIMSKVVGELSGN